MSRRYGPENLRILKKSQLRLDRRQRVEFLPLSHGFEFSTVAAVVKFFGSRPAEMN